MEAEDKNCSQEMIDYIHLTKTAALIVAAIRAGAQLGNCDPEMLAQLIAGLKNKPLPGNAQKYDETEESFDEN